MGLWELSFRAQYEYPFIDISRAHPELGISLWCVWDRELVQLNGPDPEDLARAERELGRLGRVVERWSDPAGGRRLLLECTCEEYTSMWNLAGEHRLLESPPFEFRDGWGYFRLLSFDEARSRSLFRDLRERGTVELLRKRELSLSILPTSVWVHGLFNGLTERQMHALLEAHRLGYYRSPRPVTTEEIARTLGVSRSTYEEHLRKAENRIMGELAPYLTLYAKAHHAPDVMLLPRTPAHAKDSVGA